MFNELEIKRCGYELAPWGLWPSYWAALRSSLRGVDACG